MNRRLVLATGNHDKVSELRRLFADLPVEVVAAVDLGPVPAVIEDGQTLEANALKKARAFAAHCGAMCVADDTGLEVDALGGAPGVYAARYAGPDASYADNCVKLLRELEGVPPQQRGARFRTVMALVDPVTGAGGTAGRAAEMETTVEGVLEGRILESARGDRGFGYDPLFFVSELGCTLAELDVDEKNRISHRARAARRMLEWLRGYLGQVGA